MSFRNINKQKIKEQFLKDGFVIIKNVIPEKLLQSMQKDSDSLAKTLDSNIRQKVWHERVIFRRNSFREIIKLPLLFQLAELLIGDDVQLLAADLKKQSSKGQGIQWHRDVNFICNKTLSMNSAIYFQDVCQEIGSFEIIPGSHKEDKQYTDEELKIKKVEILAKKGDILFFDAAILHKANPNISIDKERWALFLFFGHYWIKRMGDFFQSPLPQELSKTNSPELKQLLGIKLRDDIDSYHGDNEDYNLLRGEPGIDF